MKDDIRSRDALLAEIERLRTRLRLLEAQPAGTATAVPEGDLLVRLLGNLRESVVITDADRRITYWGRGAEALYGYTAEEVAGRAVTEVVGLGADRQEAARLAAVAETGFWRGEYEQQRKDGTRFWAETTISGITDTEGALIGYIGIDRDVTARRQSQASLRNSELRYRTLFEVANDAILTVSFDGQILDANPAASALLGYTLEELRTLAGEDIVAPDQQDRTRVEWQKNQDEKGRFVVETIWIQRDGQRVDVRVSGCPFEVHGVTQVQLIGHDISAQKQIEQDLRRAKEEAEAAARERMTFLSNMSHEIRTPLTAIIGFSALLQDEVEGEPQEFADLIGRSARRLLDTLNSILDLSRLESGRVQLSPELVDVRAEVHDAIALLRPGAEARGLEVIIEIAAEELTAYLDRTALHRCLVNLISNAVKYTPEGYVRVHASATEEEVVVTVEDSGIGISADFLPVLFQTFSRAKNKQTESVVGSGLGLTITQRLIALMEGVLDVKSEEGQGSAFTVRLPRRLPEVPIAR